MNMLRAILVFTVLILLIFLIQPVSATWWDLNYSKQMNITLVGGASGTQTNHLMLLNVTYDSNMQTDFDDLRFTNETHQINARLESKVDNSYALVWVEFPTTPANGVNQTYHLYYNNLLVSSDWCGAEIFEKCKLFDDFDDGTINTTLWTSHAVSGSPTIEETGGYLRIYTTDTSVGHVYSDNAFNNVSFRYRFYTPSDTNIQIHVSDTQGIISQDGERLIWSSHNSVWKFQKSVSSSWSDIGAVSNDTTNWWVSESFRNVSLARTFHNNVQIGADQTVNAGAKYLVFRAQQATSDLRVDWVFVYENVTSPPIYTFGSETDSGNVVPQWANQTQNVSSIVQNGSILLSANGQDATGLYYSWLSTNETGTWQNFTTMDATVNDYQLLTQTNLGTELCAGTYRFTSYSEITSDYSKFLVHHTPNGTPGQVIAYRWYYPSNNSWSTDNIVFDDYVVDASSLVVMNATRWLYTFRKISDNSIYDIWTNDSGATWSSPVVSPFNGDTLWVKFSSIENDTGKYGVFWVPTSDSTHMHQKFFYITNESYGAETVAWTLSNSDNDLSGGDIIYQNGTYYAYTAATTGYAQYRTSTNLINWSSSISTGVQRQDGLGYCVDCDDNFCYMNLGNPALETKIYSIDKTLLNTTGWTYRLDLNVSNSGIPTLKVINNTHLIATNQEHTAHVQYGMLVKTHTITESKYGSPIYLAGSTNWEWANFTWSNSDYSNTTIGWKICFNDTSGLANCTDVMTFDITDGTPIITLLSQTPSILYKNSTGYLNISYGIYHNSSGLNNTSVSFIYRNYDWDLSDSNHSIRPPANDLASVWNFNGRILRAANRNETPGLNFENNDTITGGDTYTWSGLDENSTKLTIVPVNSTYTKIYINATVHCIMPQMWYLDRTDQQEATKTQLPIHKTQNVLIKFWNFEIYKGNYDFLGVGYTDTSLHSNPALWPSDANPVNFYYVNSSYDPATGGDPITSGYAVYMGSLNASGWTDHVYSPHTNSNYVRGFIDNTYLHTVINTTNISYLYFTSNTESSKPYYINMTNVASSTNVSFANTNTLWAGNTPPFTAQSYTPNVWFAFMKLNMSLDHKLYAADNNDLWGSSSMNRTNITQALFSPTTPTIDHFHFLGETDYDMDGVYYGNFSIGCGVSSDPDGGDVTHNLTLHYGNGTFVTIINNTFTDKDITHNGVYFDANFSSIPYYSQTENYTLRLMAVDDESESVTVWLNKNFSLDESPRIISYSPDTPVSSAEGENQTFSITTNLPGNVTWYLDGVELFNETSVNTSSYSNENASLGSHNVTVITTNTNGSNSQKWDWNVRTELWSLIEDSVAWGISVAQYLVSNIGIVIVTAFSLICILILMMLIGAALSVTKIIYR